MKVEGEFNMKTNIMSHMAVFVLLSSLAWCQVDFKVKDTIWVGTDLQLGLSRESVMSRLAEISNLERNGNIDSWFVKSKTAPFERYGQVSFSNGSLSCASRIWTGGEEDDLSFAKVLHGALEQFGKE